MPTELSYLSQPYLVYLIGPLWLAAGVADWLMAVLQGFGPQVADFNLSLKALPLPRHYVLWLVSMIVAFELLPYGQEFLRTLRARLVGRCNQPHGLLPLVVGGGVQHRHRPLFL